MNTEWAKTRDASDRNFWEFAEGLKIRFAIQLDEYMKAEEINKAELARRMGVSPPMISKILRGDANLTIETIAKIVFALDADFHQKICRREFKARWVGLLDCRSESGHRAYATPINRDVTSSWKHLATNNKKVLNERVSVAA